MANTAVGCYSKFIISELRKQGITRGGELKYCKDRISNAHRGKSCFDNFRLSVNGQNDEEYNRQLENGCCDLHDETIQLNSGSIVKFGFNYSD